MSFVCECLGLVIARKMRFPTPWSFYAMLVIFELPYFVLALSDIRLPPSLITPTQPQNVFSDGQKFILECDAHGVPLPRLKWLKNGRELTGMDLESSTGEIRKKLQLQASHSAHEYQCLFENEHGVALSPPMNAQNVHLDAGEKQLKGRKLRTREFEPLVIKCGEHSSVPPPSYIWEITSHDGQKSLMNSKSLPKEILLSDEGDLYFTYVSKNLLRGTNSTFKCYIWSKYLDIKQGLDSTTVELEEGNGTFHPPLPVVISESPVVLLEGSSVSLKCFFSGYPFPEVHWNFTNEVRNFPNISSSWMINLTATDNASNASVEGHYHCSASNELGSQKKTIQVIVQAAPIFKTLHDGPRDFNATTGDSISIHCNPHAIPPAEITWLRNGLPLIYDMPENYHISGDSKLLRIANVCKSCLRPDLAVIQCMAKNPHGTLWGTGYVNVLERTKIVTAPESIVISALTTRLSFECVAESDDGTPIKTFWYKLMDGEVVLKTYRDLRISLDNQSLVINPQNSSMLKNFVGNYSCVASNGYSKDVRNFTVSLPEELNSLPVIFKAADTEGTVYAVALMLALLMLLLLLAFLCYKNQRCATYLVDEKERENGNEPEKELESNGFLVYSRPEQKLIQGSRLSLISSGISYGNVSLSEYGDTEAGKYDEDGSFIGNYGVEYK